MNRKYLSFAVSFLFVALLTIHPAIGAAYRYVTPSVPKASPQLKAQIAKYKYGNYTGAMTELEDMLKKDRNNVLARYYLALCYTQLGLRDNAQRAFQDIINKNANETVTVYSKYALECLNNPTSEICQAPIGAPPKKEETSEDGDAKKDDLSPAQADIDAFIKSGRMIHPEAADAISVERMKRKMEEVEYKRQQQQNDQIRTDIQSYNSQPTNEEIAAALNTLSKIGMNPFNQNMFAGVNYLSNNTYPVYPQMNNQDIARMLLYGQYNQPWGMQLNNINNMMNYGI